MDKLDFAILDLLLNSYQAVTKMRAVTQKTILLEITANSNTLYRRLTGLVGKGYIAKGIMESREHTYFITETGKSILKEVMG